MQTGPRFSFWAYAVNQPGAMPSMASDVPAAEAQTVTSRARALVEKTGFAHVGDSPLLVCPEWTEAMGPDGAV